MTAAGTSRPGGRFVAVTGTSTFLGADLLRRLDEDPRVEQVLALDIRPPDVLTGSGTGAAKVTYLPVDLTQPTVDDDLAEILRARRIDTLVHGAFLSHPTHASEWAHELEDVGTMHVLNACASAALRRVVMISSTQVYGAHPHNPNFLTESAELRGHRDSRFINDRVRAEKQAARFAVENPATSVCVLRFAPLLGPSVSNQHTRFLSRPVAPVMAGHDPLMQFVHERDAGSALALATLADARGPFNIVGKGVLPYSTVLALLGRVAVPIPYLLARPIAKALWTTHLTRSPASLLDFLLYLCVADGDRARRELGFSIRRTLLDFLGVPPEDFATDVARAQG
jgi:UDP-glucose 4-epimerase